MWNYRLILLMSYSMKIWEEIIENRVKNEIFVIKISLSLYQRGKNI